MPGKTDTMRLNRLLVKAVRVWPVAAGREQVHRMQDECRGIGVHAAQPRPRPDRTMVTRSANVMRPAGRSSRTPVVRGAMDMSTHANVLALLTGLPLHLQHLLAVHALMGHALTSTGHGRHGPHDVEITS